MSKSNSDFDFDLKTLKGAAQYENVFQAFMLCSRELQTHAIKMMSDINNTDTSKDEKQLALLTLKDIFLVNPSVEIDLEEENVGFAKRLNEIMIDKNITEKQLAEMIELNQSTIELMLDRQFYPQHTIVIKIAKALKVEISDLIKE